MSAALVRMEILEFFGRYCHAIDHHDRAGLASRFAEDATFRVAQPDGTVERELVGREAIVDFISSFWPGHTEQPRHFVLNVVLDDVTDTDARARAYLLLTFSGSDGVKPTTTGDYRSALVRRDGQWQLLEHTLSVDQ